MRASRQSRERLALAGAWVEALGCPAGAVALVSGSVGLGLADDASDIDLYVFDDGPGAPPPAAAALQVHGLEPRFATRTARGGTLERFAHGTVLVDLERCPQSVLEATMDAVVVHLDVDPRKQKVLRGLLDAVPVHGQARWREWCLRLARYPRPLSVRMIRAHLQFDPLVRLRRRTLERGDALAFASGLTAFITHVLGLLAGLNAYYFAAAPGLLKWTDYHLGRMARVPPALPQVLRDALREPSDAHLAALERLAGALLDRVDAEFPEVSTRTVRTHLGQAGGSTAATA